VSERHLQRGSACIAATALQRAPATRSPLACEEAYSVEDSAPRTIKFDSPRLTNGAKGP